MQTFAMAFPVAADKVPALRDLADLLGGARRADFEDFLRRLNVSEERWYLQTIGGVPHCIMFLAAADIAAAFAQLAASQHAFDRWMKERNREIFQIDFEHPGDDPMPETLLEYPSARSASD